MWIILIGIGEAVHLAEVTKRKNEGISVAENFLGIQSREQRQNAARQWE
jgi:hypothetical protein